MGLSKYLIGLMALALAGSLAFAQVQSIRVSSLKSKNEQLSLMKEHLEDDVESLEIRLTQQKAQFDREKEVLAGITKIVEELKNEPVTTSCGPSVHRALDLIRMRDNSMDSENPDSQR